MKGSIFTKDLLLAACFTVLPPLSIFMYGSYRCDHPEYKDILETRLGISELDGWSLSHLLFFMLAGYIFKGDYLIGAFVIGVLWELFEHYYGVHRPGWLGGYGDCIQTDRLQGNWWYGKWSDIIMNGLGIYIGTLLKKY